MFIICQENILEQSVSETAKNVFYDKKLEDTQITNKKNRKNSKKKTITTKDSYKLLSAQNQKELDYIKAYYDVCNLYFSSLSSESFYSVLSIYNEMFRTFPGFFETLKCFIWLCFLIGEQADNRDLLTIIELYDDFISLYSFSPFKAFVLKCLSKYLLRINLNNGNVDYIHFTEQIYEDMEFLDNIRFQPNIEQLRIARLVNITKLIKPFAQSPQFTFALLQAKSFIYTAEIDPAILLYSYLLIIYIYLSLDLYELALFYFTELKDKHSQYLNAIDRKILEDIKLKLITKHKK